MVRTVLYIFFIFVCYYVLKLFLRTLFPPGTRKKTHPEAEELVQDPCCLTYISKRVALKKRISGKEVHFCGEECLRNYLKDLVRGHLSLFTDDRSLFTFSSSPRHSILDTPWPLATCHLSLI